MTNDEWLETSAADVITDFLVVMMGMIMSAAGGALGGIATKIASAFVIYEMDKSLEASAAIGQKFTEKIRANLDPDREDPRRNGLTLVAAWSAFESTFDDFAKAVILERPEVLRNKDISRLRVAMNQLFAEGEEKADVVYEGIKNSVGKAAGVKRCEDILKYLDLSGAVPKAIKDEVYHSQMIRHVWAHRVGIADSQFVEKARQLGFKQGDLVSVDTQQLKNYLNAIVMYAMIIMNRHRSLHGLAPVVDMFAPKEGEDNTLSEAFKSLYAAEVASGISDPSASS